MVEHYDIVIIGAGSGGLTAAPFAAQLGARVALCDQRLPGGDCLYTGCVPSKALIKAANVAWHMRHAQKWGLTAAQPAVDLGRVMDHVQDVIKQVYVFESPEALKAEGVDFFQGAARFVDDHTVEAGGTTLKADKILIATGAGPVTPAIEGIGDVPYLTYETLFDLRALPAHLLVVGNGPIGVEMAQAFLRLGAQVTLFCPAELAVARVDPDVARTLQQVFLDEGMRIRYHAQVKRVCRDGSEIVVHAGNDEVRGDTLLVATGRRPQLKPLCLDQAGIAFTDQGITVDEYLRTSTRHIYACGDCTGSFQFTHYAGWQGFQAVRNALLPGKARAVRDFCPWTIFTSPEAAQAGMSEEEARKKHGDDVQISTWPLDHVDRAQTEGETAGFVKVIHKKKGEVLGAHIVAERAGEMIHEYVLSLDQGINLQQLASAIHVYPTYSMANQQLAARFAVQSTLSGLSGKLLKGFMRFAR